MKSEGIINPQRIRQIKMGVTGNGPVIYWMSRDQRVDENWALLYAEYLALKYKKPLLVLFCLVDKFLEATLRQYDFMIKGLIETEHRLNELKISFKLLTGELTSTIPEYLSETDAFAMVTDFDPLSVKQKWKNSVAGKIKIPFYEVDAHNIVPCWVASQKEEYGAYSFRPKIKRLISEYLCGFPKIKRQDNELIVSKLTDWEKVQKEMEIDRSVKPVTWLKPGYIEGIRISEDFIENKLNEYSAHRNDPNKDSQSNLSPFLHFGQISAQNVVLNILEQVENSDDREVFLEEFIVRRELADNYCYYNANYTSVDGLKSWAKETLAFHKKNEREFVYGLSEFENAQTHDDLWNAAQIEMVNRGKMHGYMRMYWAKKILEWSESPQIALDIANFLNNKYELDGRDANGYVGCAWSIGGVHDRAWAERPVYGKIRYMNKNGCKRKFNIDNYILRFHQIGSGGFL